MSEQPQRKPSPIRGFDVPFQANWVKKSERLLTVVAATDAGVVSNWRDVWDVSLVINGQVIVGAQDFTSQDAEDACWKILQHSARHRCRDIRLAAKAVAADMGWSPVQGLAVVYAFCRDEFGALTFAGMQYERPKDAGRGRTPVVDKRTTTIARMVDGWQWLTGRDAGFSEDGWLTRSIVAVSKYFGLDRRDGASFDDMRNALRSELKKMITGVAVWAPPRISTP